MKIGIDARWIFPEITGIGSYTQELIRHLAEIDHDNQYLLYFQSAEVQERTVDYARLARAPHFSSALYPYGPFSARSQWSFPRRLRNDGLDVFHSPNFMIPYRAFPRSRKGHPACVITIHDLIPLLFPEHTPRAMKSRYHRVFRAVLNEAARRSDAIITVSESSRRDIIRHMGIAPERQRDVVAIPNGVALDYQPADQPAREEKFILYVGRMDPYKNVPRLIEAFAQVQRGPLPNARLQIIGPRDARYPEVEQTIARLNIAEQVIWPGYVSGNALRQAYQEADVFVLPSLYEGFGLPVLEAMASGTPVICGNRSSLPEVAGDAARLINPESTDELVAALVDVLTIPGLAESMRVRGLHRAAQFSWRRTAEETLRVYTSFKPS